MKRIISMILVVTLCLSMIPNAIFADTKVPPVQPRYIPDEVLLDGAQIVRGPVITRQNIRPDSAGFDKAVDTALIGGLGYLIAGYVGTTMLAVTVAYYITTDYNFAAYEGVYTKYYYVRKIVDPSTAGVNVPVPYQYSWVTVVYSNSAMTDQYIVGVDWINDGGPRLARNNVIE